MSQPLTTLGIRHQHDVILPRLEAVQCLQVLLGAHDAGVQDPLVLVQLLGVAHILRHGRPFLLEVAGVHPDSTGSEDTQEKVQRGGESAAVTETEGHAECVVVGVVNGGGAEGGAGGGAAPPPAHMQENVCVCVYIWLYVLWENSQNTSRC